MSPITTRSQTEDEDMLDEVDAAERAETTSQPAVSDSRRRRLRARGIEPDEIVVPTLDAPSETRGLTAGKGRPTPSRDGETAVSGNPVTRVISTIRTYIKDVRGELGKVTWLNREEVRRLSTIVLAVTVVAAIFLGLLSFLFGSLAGAVAQTDTSIPAGIAVCVIIVVVAGLWLLRERLFPDQE